MTQTPNSPQELFNLNKSQQEVTPEEVLEVLDKLTPPQAILVTQLLLNKLSDFHWTIVTDINKGECEQPLQPWVHDATICSNVLQQFENLTDFQQ